MTGGFTGLQAVTILCVKVLMLEFLQNTVIFHIHVARFLEVEDHTQLTLCKTFFHKNAQQSIVFSKMLKKFIFFNEEVVVFQLTKIYPIFELVQKNLWRLLVGIAQVKQAAQESQSLLRAIFLYGDRMAQVEIASQQQQEQEQEDEQTDGERDQ